jgi:hypothetical protein
LFSTALFLTTSPVWPQTIGGGSGLRPYNPPPTADAKYSLSGTIVNSVTGEPVRHALVQIYAQSARMVFSDTEGHFQFMHLPQMETTINVIKPGFIQEGQTEQWVPRRKMVPIGPDTSPVTLRLIPGAQVEGRVTDSTGEPLDNVAVKLFSFSIREGIRKRQGFRQVQTDEDGQFQFSDLPPGDYMASAGPSWKDLSDPFQAGSRDGLAYGQVFYPGVPEIAEASILHLTAAKRQQIDFSLSTARTFAVSGSVVGGIAGRWSLQFVNSVGQEVSIAQRHDGPDSFRARVIAGPCLVKAHYSDEQGNYFYGQLELNVSSDLRGVRINLGQIQIPVTVQRVEQRETSPELRGASGRRFDAPVSLRLISLDPAHPDGSSEMKGGPENWTSAITNIEFGRYRVELNEGEPWYAQSITYEGTDLRFEPLVIGSDASQPIDIILRNDSATLMVTVASAVEQQPTQAVIIAIAEQTPSKPVVRYSFDPKQALYFSLPPGKYSVYAFEDLTDLEYANPEVMKKFSASATALELQPNQKSSVSTNLIRRTE